MEFEDDDAETLDMFLKCDTPTPVTSINLHTEQQQPNTSMHKVEVSSYEEQKTGISTLESVNSCDEHEPGTSMLEPVRTDTFHKKYITVETVINTETDAQKSISRSTVNTTSTSLTKLETHARLKTGETHSKTEPQTEPDKSTYNKSETETKNIDIPSDFAFPFPPYDIQVGFMKALYQTLECGNIGIFESPTGTGKSLSLICGALTWLTQYDEPQQTKLGKLLSHGVGNLCLPMGKSLSLICGALTWLTRYEESQQTELGKLLSHGVGNVSCVESGDTEEVDWIAEYSKKKNLLDENEKMQEEHELRIKRETRIQELRNSVAPKTCAYRAKRKKLDDDFDDLMKGASPEIRDKMKADDSLNDDNDDDDNIMVDYDSDEAREEAVEEDCADVNLTKCLEISFLEAMSQWWSTPQVPSWAVIFFCSRTHSQLTQFVNEVRKSAFVDKCRVVSLASRQTMCINEAVSKLKSLSLINDRCLELQKNKTEKKGEKRRKVGCRCPYYRPQPMQECGDKIMAEVQDIEQLVSLGKKHKACPYYSTRLAVPSAQLVCLPYHMLLHKSTREACGIKLKDNIVIIDEAHNLLETINNIHSVQVTGAQLCRCHSQLSQYLQRYTSRLKAKNVLYIRQILYVVSSLVKAVGGNTNQDPVTQVIARSGTTLSTVNNFLISTRIDNINMYKLVQYCQGSQIARKLHGFVEKYKPPLIAVIEDKESDTKSSGVSRFLKQITTPEQDDALTIPPSSVEQPDAAILSSPLSHIQSFLSALTNADKDGRFVVTKNGNVSQSSIKYLLLNPAVHFCDVVKEARSVVVAGGTMQPVSEFKDQLFHAAGIPPQRITHYSCGHVISGDQLLPIAVRNGPTSIPLDFTYQSRNSPKLDLVIRYMLVLHHGSVREDVSKASNVQHAFNKIEELGRLLVNVCKVVPGGVVCFFPSYEYEKQIHTRWSADGTLLRLELKKKIFREPKNSSRVENILKEYGDFIKTCESPSVPQTGGLIFCVVGGKMSEGINFSDDLGRCIIMIGMPYPNITSPELKEKIAYLDNNFPKTADGKTAGKVHYENLCMKAVNQSIGRAIRHRNDHATILLLDSRYHRPSTIAGLPSWISQHLLKCDSFGQTYAAICKFFNKMKAR